MVTGHAGLIHTFNRSLVLQAVRRLQPVSRAALCRETDLTSATVSHLVQELIDEGFVTETLQGRSSGGRRPMLLEMNDRQHFFLGLEIGVRRCTAVVLDLKARVRARATMGTPGGPRGDTVGKLSGLCGDVLRKAGVERRNVVELGVTIPGVWDAGRGCIEMTPNLPGWRGMEIGQLMAEATGVNTKVENDANAAALAEKWFGAGRGLADIIYVQWDVGIGSGIIMDGRLLNGDGFGEIGHLTVDMQGRLCSCGNRGCLEAMASLALIEGDMGNKDPQSTAGRAVLGRIGAVLGTALGGLVNVLVPETIILGGPAVRKFPVLGAIAFETARRRALGAQRQRVKMVESQLGVDVCALGAAALVMEDVFVPLRVQVKESSHLAPGNQVQQGR